MDIKWIEQWFSEAVPEPTDKNRSTQFGVHVEEVSEMFTSVGEHLIAAKMNAIGNEFKAGSTFTNIDRQELLDSLCDQIVTAIGVAHMFGFDISGALSEVNRSNWSKFVDGKPLFDENGKIKKGSYYSKPDLTPFV